MVGAPSLIPELEEIAENGSPEKRAQAIERISLFFLQNAERFKTEHVDFFDEVFVNLVPTTEIYARVELAERMSRLGNAPPTLMTQLAREDEIKIAGPVLTHSPTLDEPTLVDVARMKGQSHLAAISGRSTLSTPVTDVIVRRGTRDIVRTVAANAGAKFSEAGYSRLLRHVRDDGMLALTVGQRDDISPSSLKELLTRSIDTVRRRLFDLAKPDKKIAISQAMAEISGVSNEHLADRDFGLAQRVIITLHQVGRLNEAALFEFAKHHKYEETVVALATMSGVRIATVHQLVLSGRSDPILILCRSIGMEWTTVQALLALGLGAGKVSSAPDTEDARINYARLAPAMAQRVLDFWRARETAGA